MFGFKRWQAKRKRMEELHIMFHTALSILPGWKMQKGCSSTWGITFPVPWDLKGSPLQLVLISGWGFFKAQLRYAHPHEFDEQILITELIFSDSMERDLKEPEDEVERDLLNKALKIVTDSITAAELAKELKEDTDERLRKKIIANLSYGALTESSVLGALND
jgi:hypothetical protein